MDNQISKDSSERAPHHRLSRPKIRAIWIAVLLTAVIGRYAYRQLRQIISEAGSLKNCEDSGLGSWRWLLNEAEDNGKLPGKAEREQIAARFKRETPYALQCNEGGDYLWNPDPINTSVLPAVPIVWCGRPHGVTEKWRNVVYSDYSLRRVPEEIARGWRHE